MAEANALSSSFSASRGGCVCLRFWGVRRCCALHTPRGDELRTAAQQHRGEKSRDMGRWRGFVKGEEDRVYAHTCAHASSVCVVVMSVPLAYSSAAAMETAVERRGEAGVELHVRHIHPLPPYDPHSHMSLREGEEGKRFVDSGSTQKRTAAAAPVRLPNIACLLCFSYSNSPPFRLVILVCACS